MLNPSLSLRTFITIRIKKSLLSRETSQTSAGGVPWVSCVTFSLIMMLIWKTRQLSSHLEMIGIKSYTSFPTRHCGSCDVSKNSWKHGLGFVRIQRLYFYPLIADTFRSLDIVMITRAEHLGCSVTILQIWFLEHFILWWPLVPKGLFKKTNQGSI